jgi:hypothetical protein
VGRGMGWREEWNMGRGCGEEMLLGDALCSIHVLKKNYLTEIDPH